MRKIALLAVLIAGVLLFAVANDAGAECSVEGWIYYSFADVSGLYIYVSMGGSEPVYSFFVPSGTAAGGEYFRAAITGAQAGSFYVAVTGDAAACPVVGQWRWGGTLRSFWSQYSF